MGVEIVELVLMALALACGLHSTPHGPATIWLHDVEG